MVKRSAAIMWMNRGIKCSCNCVWQCDGALSIEITTNMITTEYDESKVRSTKINTNRNSTAAAAAATVAKVQHNKKNCTAKFRSHRRQRQQTDDFIMICLVWNTVRVYNKYIDNTHTRRERSNSLDTIKHPQNVQVQALWYATYFRMRILPYIHTGFGPLLYPLIHFICTFESVRTTHFH